MSDNLITAFFTKGGLPAIGLSPLPTIRIWEVSASTSTLVVTDAIMTEVADGFYKYEFVGLDPLKGYLIRADSGPSQSAEERYSIGTNNLSEEKIADAVWDENASDHNTAGTTGGTLGALPSDITNIEQLVTVLRKYQSNRTKIDPGPRTLTVYDDDKVTPLQVFNLYDSTGQLSTAQIAEKVPTL